MSETWNVPEMENKLQSIFSLSTIAGMEGGENLMNSIRAALGERGEAHVAAIRELHAIRNNTKDNPTPYHLNCIHSGTTLFSAHTIVHDEEGNATFKDIGDFGTAEEAQAALDKIPDEENVEKTVYEYDPDEWWAILRNDDGKNATGMLYPYELRALAFIYRFSPTPCFDADVVIHGGGHKKSDITATDKEDCKEEGVEESA